MKLPLKISIGYQVLYAVVLGIFAGLFFGPLCAILTPIATAFTMLVQMVVLPYICFSLIHGLGSITPTTGKRLMKWGLPFLLLIWSVVLLIVFITQQLIPTPSSSVVLTPSSGQLATLSSELLKFLVPENPIYDLANNIVPAIAVFGLIAGTALMHSSKKKSLCDILEGINVVIEKILDWLAAISPIGAFAHMALAFGTVRFEDLYKLEFYVFCFIGMSLFITFWILPLILSCMTPLTYKEVLKAFRFVCLLPFVTAMSSLSVPFLNTYLKSLSKKTGESNFHTSSQTVLPLAYSFGQIGNCVSLFFLLFLSFYYRQPLEGTQKVLLSILSLPMSVGSSSNSVSAISFLIDQFKFPEEALELFMETSAITTNFQALMSVASVLTLILLTIFGYYGLLKIRWKTLTVRLGSTLLLFAILVFSAKPLISVGNKFQNLYLGLSITDVIENPAKAKVFTSPEGSTRRDGSAEILEQIIGSGVLKVGYNTVEIPYCYKNAQGNLAGFDMAYAYELASDLDCKIEFIPTDFVDVTQELNLGYYDIGMAAFLMTEERLKQVNFTRHYSEQNLVLVVPADKKKSFLNLNTLVEDPNLKIGSFGAYASFIGKHFPMAKQISYPTVDIAAIKKGEVDAWIWVRDLATIWCLSHPDFIVVDYGGLIGKTYFAYAIRNDAYKLEAYLNNSMILKELSGFQEKMYDYWIKGESVQKKPPRWSILRNILKVTE